ncbi:unnamed protein product [Boreogadus saida]
MVEVMEAEMVVMERVVKGWVLVLKGVEGVKVVVDEGGRMVGVEVVVVVVVVVVVLVVLKGVEVVVVLKGVVVVVVEVVVKGSVGVVVNWGLGWVVVLKGVEVVLVVGRSEVRMWFGRLTLNGTGFDLCPVFEQDVLPVTLF